jgi:hypothetical protein
MLMRHSQHSQSRGQSDVRVAYAGLCLALLLQSGCGVDDRTLTGDAGAGAANVSGSGGAAGNFHSGAAGGDTQALPRCFYLGSSVETGCETLVKNAGFGSNVASWSAEPLGISEGWLNADAKDDPDSGSLVVMNLNYKEDPEAATGTNGGGARQCVPVTAGQTYDLAADVFIPSGQGAGFQGMQYTAAATLSAFYYEEGACAGRSTSNFTSTPVDKTDEWVHVEGSSTAPKESQSMAVRLATLKAFRQVMFEAHFDNVLVRERPEP